MLKTPEDTWTKQRTGGGQVGSTGPTCQAGLPRPTWKPSPLRPMASNRPLRRILTLVLYRFDPRVVVHPTGLYKQKQTPRDIDQSIHHISQFRGDSRKDNLELHKLGHSQKHKNRNQRSQATLGFWIQSRGGQVQPCTSLIFNIVNLFVLFIFQFIYLLFQFIIQIICFILFLFIQFLSSSSCSCLVHVLIGYRYESVLGWPDLHDSRSKE